LHERDRVRQSVCHRREVQLRPVLREQGALPDRGQVDIPALTVQLGVGALNKSRHPGDELFVVLAVPRLVELELLVEIVLLGIGQYCDAPAQEWLAILVADICGGEAGRAAGIMYCAAWYLYVPCVPSVLLSL